MNLPYQRLLKLSGRIPVLPLQIFSKMGRCIISKFLDVFYICTPHFYEGVIHGEIYECKLRTFLHTNANHQMNGGKF